MVPDTEKHHGRARKRTRFAVETIKIPDADRGLAFLLVHVLSRYEPEV